MPEVLVGNLEADVVERLKARARDGGRSFQAELKLILEQAARQAPVRPSRAEYRVLVDRIRAFPGDRPQSDSAALLAEYRER